MYVYIIFILDEKYAHIVLKSNTGADLFNLKSLLNLCHIEQMLIETKYYEDLCVTKDVKSTTCCEPWSLGNYIALLNKRNSCLSINVSI